MQRASATRWFRLRVAFALGVLALLAVELSGHRSLLVTIPQALLILGIIATSALDLRGHPSPQGSSSRATLEVTSNAGPGRRQRSGLGSIACGTCSAVDVRRRLRESLRRRGQRMTRKPIPKRRRVRILSAQRPPRRRVLPDVQLDRVQDPGPFLLLRPGPGRRPPHAPTSPPTPASTSASGSH
jgi:hypothetical protein